ncbi:MAG: Rieske 2Fe-2S domain-containing protein [Gammaproteobacteria bacterium]|nr:Rieske 2Fe-2S domain-containing protein [Gammaproteobacteria bacterium]NIR82823.1 Rieske 2Fe-2S domain-containing protein [Gammaproteobacteria bacterium]NIR89932.1 Rieske 2Fe-2S domain-containing protein [Gammaproteobacteria bacterium]NIU03981.1 Rieske 2Fe-2S domain-containing protein [Gammaproteobacteria bacterium]NIV51301.1 Rieske 2Fe-2S domain-containing protein [Gammaproteobacteria bacterium]
MRPATRPASARALCRLRDIHDPGSRGFRVECGGKAVSIFVVRRGDAVYGYVNCCPHTGVNLDWLPGQFLDPEGALIVCATHGALFRIEDGYCVGGPCAGDSLRRVPLRIEQGQVMLDGA